MKLKRIVIILLVAVLSFGVMAGCKKKPKPVPDATINVEDLGTQNLLRSIQLSENTIFKFVDKNLYDKSGIISLANSMNVETGKKSGERGSVWRYTSMIEMINKVLHNIKGIKEDNEFYTNLYNYYTTLLKKMVGDLEYYRGTLNLVSYTQPGFPNDDTKTSGKEWSVFGVNRATEKGEANVEHELAVYDDQMWLIRELIESYKVTGDAAYLAEAEYLTAYVLDGWDQSFRDGDVSHGEYGGFTWGHGYTTKHTCSNGPMISPLVWLYEIYKDKADTTEFYKLTAPGTVEKTTPLKKDLYLEYAKKTYAFVSSKLINGEGVYADMLGATDAIQSKVYNAGTPQEAEYRISIDMHGQSGRTFTYNSGSVLSGIVDLYRVTEGEEKAAYLEDAKKLADASFVKFADAKVKEGYFAFPSHNQDNIWFNTVLYRAYAELTPYYSEANYYVGEIQKMMNYGYDNFYRDGLLPRNLYQGWLMGYGHDTEKYMSMDGFANSINFGILADYELNIKK